jgi:DNA-binding winged helix-turn-helix (wHTH) protein/TolB-like protein
MEYAFDGYTLDIERRELRCGGESRHVEPQVFDLLHFLIANRERVVSRDEIFQAVWHGRIVLNTVLSTRLNAARAAIGDDGTQQRLIRTVHGKGFRFVGALYAVTDPPSAPAVLPAYRLAFALKDTPVIAVSPFASTGDDGHVRILAEALTEAVAVSLYEIDWLRVAASYSGAIPAASLSHSKAKVGKLRARYLLLGSVRRDQGELRIVVRLMEVRSGIHLWVERFQCPIVDSFHVRDQIAARVACAVKDRIFAAESLRSRQKSPESLGAWESIVGAVALMNTRKKPDFGVAQAMLRKAIRIDPKSAPSFSLLSIMATLSLHLGWNAQATVRPIALRAAEKALDLDSEDGWGHVALGYARLLTENRPEEAIDVLAAALKLNPALATAHYLIALASVYTGNAAASFHHADLAEHLATRLAGAGQCRYARERSRHRKLCCRPLSGRDLICAKGDSAQSKTNARLSPACLESRVCRRPRAGGGRIRDDQNAGSQRLPLVTATGNKVE